MNAVAAWTVDDVLDWLAADMELPQYTRAFRENMMDGPQLLTLTPDDLADLGITNQAHLGKLVDALDDIRRDDWLQSGSDEEFEASADPHDLGISHGSHLSHGSHGSHSALPSLAGVSPGSGSPPISKAPWMKPLPWQK